MASNLRRTDDLQRLRVRELFLQNTNGSYAADGSVPYIEGANGFVQTNSGVTIPGYGDLDVPGTLTVGDVSAGSGSFTTLTAVDLSASSIVAGDVSAGSGTFTTLTAADLSFSAISVSTLSVGDLSAGSIVADDISVNTLHVLSDMDISGTLGVYGSGSIHYPTIPPGTNTQVFIDASADADFRGLWINNDSYGPAAKGTLLIDGRGGALFATVGSAANVAPKYEGGGGTASIYTSGDTPGGLTLSSQTNAIRFYTRDPSDLTVYERVRIDDRFGTDASSGVHVKRDDVDVIIGFDTSYNHGSIQCMAGNLAGGYALDINPLGGQINLSRDTNLLNDIVLVNSNLIVGNPGATSNPHQVATYGIANAHTSIFTNATTTGVGFRNSANYGANLSVRESDNKIVLDSQAPSGNWNILTWDLSGRYTDMETYLTVNRSGTTANGEFYIFNSSGERVKVVCTPTRSFIGPTVTGGTLITPGIYFNHLVPSLTIEDQVAYKYITCVSGNVGINQSTPAYTLDVNGATRIVGDLGVIGDFAASGVKAFKIPHPTIVEKTLYHIAIEGPRADLIYRGRARLTGGRATVSIDTESTANGGMTVGTFEALCANPQVFLTNNDTWDRVRGSVTGGVLTIEAESAGSTAWIDWMVVAERKDASIRASAITDEDGFLVPEWPANSA